MSDNHLSSDRIKIMMIEDHTGFREALALALELEEQFELVASYGSIERAVVNLEQSLDAGQLDILLLDLNLPGISGLEGLREIHRVNPSLKVIIITQSKMESDVLEAIRLGAAGYLLKSSTMKQIKQGILAVSQGGATIDPSLASYILETLQSQLPSDDGDKTQLTEREMDVLNSIAEGYSHKEIGVQMGISNYTVTDHLKRIYGKLKVQNAPQAIAKAYQKGIFKLR